MFSKTKSTQIALSLMFALSPLLLCMGQVFAQGVPNIVVTPTSLDFGSVLTHASATRTLTVRNTGTAVLLVNLISSLSFSVDDPAVFAVPANGEHTATVRFRPTTVGSHDSELRIIHNDLDAGPISIPLQGVGVQGEEVPNIVVATDPLDFGSVLTDASTTHTLTVHNRGTAVLLVNPIPSPSFSVDDPAVFAVPVNGEHTATVRFRPTTVGPHDGELRIVHNDPDAGPISIPLQGVGVRPEAHLTVRKILRHPDCHQLRLFNLQIDGVTVRANVNGGSTGPQSVSPGIHRVGETGGTGTILGDFHTVIGGDCNNNGIVNLAHGDNKTCTITNFDNIGGCACSPPPGTFCAEPGFGEQGCLQCVGGQ
jgi:hypothetical protein